MSKPIEFTDNYQDLSTDNGYQFKFMCERCGNGYMSSYQQNKLGVASGLLRGSSSFTGGIFGKGANSAYEVQRAIGGKQHDGALQKAVEEIKPMFKQCRHCGDWSCEDVCWNPSADMCKECAPVAVDIETSSRAKFVETQVNNDQFLEENLRMSAKAKQVNANCANCNAETLGKKFCPECGQATAPASAAFCGECGAKATPGSKFCGECGKQLVA